MADLEQWVNVERKKDFVEDEIASEERLGSGVHFECKFKKATPASFKVRVVPVGSQAEYAKKERARNASFKLRALGAKAKPEGTKVKLEADYALPCGGGNRFQIEAKYKGTVVQSKKVLAARRRFFYQVLSMQGIAPHALQGMEADFWNPDKKYFVKLVEKAPRATIQLVKTVHQDNYVPFIHAAKSGYALEKRRPYAFAVVFSNFIAQYKSDRYREDVDLDAPSGAWSIVKDAHGHPTKARLTLGRHLWYDMDPAHDAARFWLVANRTRFVASDGTTMPIPDSDVAVVGPPQYPLGGYRTIEITLGTAVQNLFTSQKGKLKVDLELNFVKGWILGFSFTGINLITVANYSRWQPSDPTRHAQTLNHELGHKIGMVATGKGFLPDPPATYYQESPAVNYGGHLGPHCGKGARYSAAQDSWSGAPGCVMFGADAAYVGGVRHWTPKEFCESCEKIVRKLDLDPAHLYGFKASIKDY